MKRRRALSILPTGGLATLLFVLAVIWYAAASQNNAAAYLLLFALASVVLVSVPHTLANISGLTATLESIKPAFAGQEISLPVEIANESVPARHGIGVTLSKSDNNGERIDNVAAGTAERVALRVPAPCRGEHRIEQLWLISVYPFGLFKVAKRIVTSQTYVVYPKPAGNPALPRDASSSTKRANRFELGEGDDFAGVRAYVEGESQRHIDWKAVARGQALMTKQFTTELDAEIYVDHAAAPQSDLEDRLSQLALWIIEAERTRRRYGLRLPNLEIAPSLGQAHFHRCLHVLALFE
jgi:uncharacterized protein (DUF58 family)